MAEFLPDEHDVAYYPEDNDPNARLRDTIETLGHHRLSDTQHLSELSTGERIAHAINEAIPKSTTDNYSIQRYTEGHHGNSPISRVILYSPSRDELTSTLGTLVLDGSRSTIDEAVLEDIAPQGQPIASYKVDDITLCEVASHVLPIYEHQDCSAVIGKYDPCGCHLITTVSHETTKRDKDSKPIKILEEGRVVRDLFHLFNAGQRHSTVNNKLGAGHEGVLEETWTVSSCQTGIKVIYRSLLSHVSESDIGHIHLHKTHIDQEQYERLTKAQRCGTSDSSGLLQVPPHTHGSHSISYRSSSSSSRGRRPK
ncbi:hypothetical protein V865_000291 [Kwoniella europaea PYCC6329]|uniref:Uncharacterized protein n=1 Tax=Kwoniella europaea PYCC6329 TaxID=1423913 RepID=A0AAX4K8T0_9TREE